jgi:hypothetical protein
MPSKKRDRKKQASVSDDEFDRLAKMLARDPEQSEDYERRRAEYRLAMAREQLWKGLG